MSKQLVRQGRMIAEMDGSITRLSDTNYTGSSQSGSWKLKVPMNRGLKIDETKPAIQQQALQ
jgi:hypothetical protein